MKDATLLYACVLEAQQTGDHLQIINSLQRVLEKYNYNAPNEIHLPALLRYASNECQPQVVSLLTNISRCTARLLIRELENPRSQVIDCIDEICKLFEGGKSTDTYSMPRTKAFKLLSRQKHQGAVRRMICSR